MRIRALVAAPGMQERDMSVFTDTRLMDGQDDTASTFVFPTPLPAGAAQVLTKSDRADVEDRHVGMTAALELAAGRRPFTVGKRDSFFYSPLSRLLRPPERTTVEGNGWTAQYHTDGSAATLWWMFGGEGRAGKGTAENDIERKEAHGDDAHRPGRPQRGVYERVTLPDHVRRGG